MCTDIKKLWNTNVEKDWIEALQHYYEQPSVKRNAELEKELASLDTSVIEKMSGSEFFDFLFDRYFVWKYTAQNRLASCRKYLSTLKNEAGYARLYDIKQRIIKCYNCYPLDTEMMLDCVTKIKGLGIAGASGLLSLLFPKEYGTIDQFVVKALKIIASSHNTSLDMEKLNSIKEDSLKLDDGVYLTGILRDKAAELNRFFNTRNWNPRKIDMILWSCNRKE